MTIYTIGHLIPDLDAIASAVVYTELLNKTKKHGQVDVVAIRAGEPNAETKAIFNKFNIQLPPKIEDVTILPEDRFVLIDHNEQSQVHPSILRDSIIEIVEHHNINVSFAKPIYLHAEPIGSSCSVVYGMFKNERIVPSQQAKELMLASILSDTVKFKSSITTARDTAVATELAADLKVNMDELAFEIFKAKSDITGLSPKEIATKDCKKYDLGGKKVIISQIETVEIEKAMEMKADLLKAMDEVTHDMEADQMYLFLTDILKVQSFGLYTNDETKVVLEKAFGVKSQNSVVLADKMISRKKDFVPAIEKALIG